MAPVLFQAFSVAFFPYFGCRSYAFGRPWSWLQLCDSDSESESDPELESESEELSSLLDSPNSRCLRNIQHTRVRMQHSFKRVSRRNPSDIHTFSLFLVHMLIINNVFRPPNSPCAGRRLFGLPAKNKSTTGSWRSRFRFCDRADTFSESSTAAAHS
jgi:hypothetical protein